MNKLRYRVIFNEALGVMMAVSELAKSHLPNASDTAEQSSPISNGFELKRLTWITSLVFGNLLWASTAGANIVADPNAAGNQKPIVIQSANGTPQVNIQTPSAAGVSRNQYSQFDVNGKGAILNNSRKPTQTELGGWVDGNQWLATGEARIILNEVNSKNPSQLNGFVEVAGQKAQVIIANPAGITCEGCGFINSDRATLTTGSVNVQNGAVTGYQVNDGKIVIQGKGLDSSRQDRTDLIARAVEVNSDVWANDLAVTTGQNKVDASHTSITKNSTQKTSNKPTIAIDVSDLGGMYAGKIRLVGTEQGVGVRNTGEIGASAGSVTITADGKLINTGTLNSQQNITATLTENIENSGTVFAERDTSLITQQHVENSGVIVARGNTDINAASLTNTSSGLIAAGINEKGKRENPGNLTLSTTGKLTTHGDMIASKKLSIDASEIDADESYVEAEDIQLSAKSGDIRTTSGTLLADKNIDVTAAGRLNNDEGIWVAKEAINIDVAKSLTLNTPQSRSANSSNLIVMSNQRGIIQAGNGLSLDTHQQALNNELGMLASFTDLTLHTGDINNRAGQIAATDNIGITSFTLNNDAAGVIQSGQNLEINTQGHLLSNTQSQLSDEQVGGILAAGALSLNTRKIDNTDGEIYAQEAITVHSDDITNLRGAISGQSDLNMLTGAVNNIEGLLQAKGQFTLNSQQQGINNTEGFLLAGDALTLKLGALENTRGVISSLGDVNAVTAGVNNTDGLIQSDAAINWQLQEAQSPTADWQNANWQNQQGLLIAQKGLTLKANTLTNHGGEIYIGDKGQLTLNTLDNREAGNLVSQGDLTLNAKNIDNRTGTLLTENTLIINNQQALNNESGLLSSLGKLAIETDTLNNNSGVMEAGDELSLSANTLVNDGDILSFGDMSIALNQTLNQLGLIQAQNDLTLNINQHLINHGTVQAGYHFTLNAENIDNQTDGELSAGELRLLARDTLTNRGLLDGIFTRIEAGNTLNNLGTGRIYGDYLAIKTPYLNNRDENGKAATIAARERLDLGIDTLDNYEHSLIYSAGDLVLGGDLNQDDVAIGQASTLNNHSATIESGRDMFLSSKVINNINDHFAVEQQIVADKYSDPSLGGIREYAIYNTNVRYGPSDVYFYNSSNDTTHVVTPSGDNDFYYEWNYDREIEETVVIQDDPAKIIAGGNLVVNSEYLLNDKSKILAGDTLLIDAGTIDNVEVKGKRIFYDRGIIIDHHVVDVRKLGVKVGVEQKHDASGYYATPSFDMYLNASVIEQNIDSPNSDRQLNNASQLKPGAPVINEVVVKQHTGNPDIDEQAPQTVIRYTPPNATLPDNSLYQVNPDQKADYLVATDPRFTNKKLWLGSDYMLAAFNSNHDNQHKRLGDGYYEQQIIKEQIISLTGNRYLGDNTNDEEQYKALMDAGIAFGQKFNLTPGIALSAEQIAQLTDDMVWLVTQTVTLADGTTQDVLVPQVYAKVQPGDLDGSGALLSAKNMQLNLKGDLNNSGRIQTGQTLLVNADNINNNAGQLRAQEMGLTATQDINNIGGSILATDTLIAKAGRDINVVTTTKSTDTSSGANSFNRTVVNQVGEMGVTGDDGVLVLDAKNDVNLTAANVFNLGEDGITQIKAGNDINLDTVQTREKNHIGGGDNYWHQESTTDVGTQVYGAGDVTLIAGNDIDSKAANVTAGGALGVQAGHNITLREGIATDTLDSQTKTSSGGLLSKKSTTTRTQIDNQSSIGSEFNGETITLIAGNDLTIQGSDVIADETLNLKAGNDVNITTANEHYFTQQTVETKKSGLMSGGGLGVFIGKKSDKTDDTYRDGVEAGSTIGSINGDVNIVAGNKATFRNADVIAGDDINVVAKDILITAAANTHDETHITESKSSGLTVSLGGSVGGALNSAFGSAQQISRDNSDRKNALLGVSSALSGAQGVQELRLANASNQPNKYGGTVGVNASYGSQSSRSEQTINQVNHDGSSFDAGGNINLTATEKDIRIEGSTLDADKNINLTANRDVLLLAKQDSSVLTGKNESKGWSLGGSIDFSGTIGLDVSVNKGKGSENGNTLTHQNTLINAGDELTITSGRDTILQGAQAKGDGITVDVGRDLRIESLQDVDNYQSKQTNLGANVGVSIGTTTTVSGGINGDRTKMDSNYASVNDQSGLFGGNKGLDVDVEGNTHLKGGVIASEGDNNSFSTGTLTFEDIQNQADFDVSSSSFGVNVGMGGLSIPGVSQSNNSGESESSTKATIGNNIDITIKDEVNQTQDIANLNRDTDNAHQSLDKIFDKDKEQERLDEQKLISDIGNQLSNIVRTEGQIRAEKAKNDPAALAEAERELRAEGKTPTEQEIKQRAENNAMRDWGVGGKYQQITQAITGALQGVFNGDLTQALANGSAPFLAEAIKNATTNPDGSVNTEANLAAHAILGALLSQANGNSALAGGLGALTAEAAAKLIKDQIYGDKSFADLTEAERQNISALAQIAAGVAGGLAGGSSSDAAQGAIVGKNAVENNYLSFEDERAKTQLEEKVKNGTATEEDKQELERLIALDITNQEAVKEACANGMTPECVAQTKLAVLGIDSYSGYAEYNTYYNLLENYPEQMAQYGDIINQYSLELIHLIDSGYSPEEAKSHLDQQIATNKQFLEAIEKLPTWAQIALTIQDTVGMVYGAKAAGTSLGKFASENKSINGTKPEWLLRVEAGNKFNKEQAKNYPMNEVYINKPDGSGYYRVDSYNPTTGEIVSRKYTQFSDISASTANNYIREALTKYPPGATIANVPSSGSLSGQQLKGNNILEVPPQIKPIPQLIIDQARKSGIVIRDTNGKVYK